MSYKVPLSCAGRCGRKNVSVEVFGRYNSSEGLFCASCGAKRLKGLERIERANDALIKKRRDEDGPDAAEKLRSQLR